jgi:hypothetical protein
MADHNTDEVAVSTTKTRDISSYQKQQTDTAWNKFVSERAANQHAEEHAAFETRALEKAKKRFAKLLLKAKKCRDFPASNYSVLDVVSCALSRKRAVVSDSGTILLGPEVIGAATRTSLGIIATLECNYKGFTWIAYNCPPTRELHFSIIGMVRLTSDNCPGFPGRIA